MSEPKNRNAKPPAVEVLDKLEGGRLLGELNEVLRGATSACLTSGGKAVVTLKLTVTGNRHADGQRVEVKPELTVKQPTPHRESSLFFVTDDGDLSRTPPRQELMRGLAEDGPERAAHREASDKPHSV